MYNNELLHCIKKKLLLLYYLPLIKKKKKGLSYINLFNFLYI